jgi:protein EFR3
MERRATSIHLHVTGETGPSSREVTNMAIRALSHLFGHSNGGQAATSMQAAIDCFNDREAWGQTQHCSWFAEHAAEWTQYQYRYAIPTRLVECLIQDQDTSQTVSRSEALAAMITAVFTSPTPLVNLSTSDIISSLINVGLRRISKNSDDALLPALVRSVSSLGTHVYYTDQIQDLAGELISRLVMVETTGYLAGVKCENDKARVQAVRYLVAGLLGLIHSAEVHDIADLDTDSKGGHKSVPSSPVLGGPGAERASIDHKGGAKGPRRKNVSADIWQDTVSLLCDSDYAIRADYSATLISYLEKEIPKLWDVTDTDGVKRIRPLAEGPVQQANVNYTILHGDNTTRLLNSLHAHIYALAISPNLGLPSPSHTPSSQRSINGDQIDSAAVTDETNTQDLTEPALQGRRSLAIPRTRKLSVMQHLLRNVPSKLTASTSVTATLSDYGNIMAIMTAIFTNLPVRGLLTGVPMLLALNAAVQLEANEAVSPRISAIREILASCWITLAKVWDCSEILEVVAKVSTALQ